MSNEIRSRFSPSRKTPEVNEGKSLTQQNFANDADVNTIVSRHLRGPGRTLQNIAMGGTRQPMFGDFSSMDYQDMLNKVTDIDNTFRRLPARLRQRFRNDPYQLIRFTEDPANLKECVKLGLVTLPEGQVMTEEGNIVEQGDILKEAGKPPAGGETAGVNPPAGSNPPPKKEGEK